MERIEHARVEIPAEHLRYVEEVATAFEQLGMVRMAGRAVGWLLICDPPEQTSHQLAHALQASKGSISNAMRYLTTSGLAEKITHPGDRRAYYRMRPDQWIDLTLRQAAYFASSAALAARGIAMLGPHDTTRLDRLREMHDFFSWLDTQMPLLLDRWRAENATDEEEP